MSSLPVADVVLVVLVTTGLSGIVGPGLRLPDPREATVAPRLTLASRILALQIGIVLAVVAAGAVASVFVARQQLDRSYEQRSLAVADSVAAGP